MGAGADDEQHLGNAGGGAGGAGGGKQQNEQQRTQPWSALIKDRYTLCYVFEKYDSLWCSLVTFLFRIAVLPFPDDTCIS